MRPRCDKACVLVVDADDDQTDGAHDVSHEIARAERGLQLRGAAAGHDHQPRKTRDHRGIERIRAGAEVDDRGPIVRDTLDERGDARSVELAVQAR